MVGGNQRKSRSIRLSKLLNDNVTVVFKYSIGETMEIGRLTRQENSNLNFGFYVNERHIPIKGLIRNSPGSHKDNYLEVNLNYSTR